MTEKSKASISKKKVAIIFTVLIVIVIGLIIAMYFIMKNDKDATSNMKVESNVVTSKEDKSNLSFEEMQKKTDASKIGVKMNIKPVFQDGNSKGNILLENTSSNGNSFTMSIVIEDTKETVYESGLIKKGTRIDEIKLDKNLEAGEYKAVAYFTAYNDKEEEQGTSGINITLNILK